MPLYSYHCGTCGDVDLRHPISEVDQAHSCPTCGAVLKRKLLPIHHRWPSNFRPGFEESGNRILLDPEFQARQKDVLAQEKEEHLNREAKKKAGAG